MIFENKISTIEQKISENEALAKNLRNETEEKLKDGILNVMKHQKEFEVQITNDFSILTNWAKNLEKKIEVQPIEIAEHVGKFIKDFENDLNKYREDINLQIQEIYKESSSEVSRIDYRINQFCQFLKVKF